MNRCLCLTTTGKQCSRDAQKGSQFCWQHLNCKKTTQPVETKKSIPKKSIPKKSIPKKSILKKTQPVESTKMNPRGQLAFDYLSKNVKGFFYTSKNERTDLRQDIEKHWVGKDYSNIGVGGPIKIDWKTRKISVLNHGLSRKDIFVINLDFEPHSNHYNIFVEPDLTYVINDFTVKNPELFKNAKKYLDDYIHYYLTVTEAPFIKQQQKWYLEKPWEKIDGKTPEEAVEILKNLGW